MFVCSLNHCLVRRKLCRIMILVMPAKHTWSGRSNWACYQFSSLLLIWPKKFWSFYFFRTGPGYSFGWVQLSRAVCLLWYLLLASICTLRHAQKYTYFVFFLHLESTMHCMSHWNNYICYFQWSYFGAIVGTEIPGLNNYRE